MSYNIRQASLYLSTYIEEQKNLIDKDFQPLLLDILTPNKDRIVELYEKMINFLDEYDKDLRINFNKKLATINSEPNTDEDMFNIKKSIHNNTLMFYYSIPSKNIYKLISFNRYLTPEDLIGYKEYLSVEHNVEHNVEHYVEHNVDTQLLYL